MKYCNEVGQSTKNILFGLKMSITCIFSLFFEGLCVCTTCHCLSPGVSCSFHFISFQSGSAPPCFPISEIIVILRDFRSAVRVAFVCCGRCQLTVLQETGVKRTFKNEHLQFAPVNECDRCAAEKYCSRENVQSSTGWLVWSEDGTDEWERTGLEHLSDQTYSDGLLIILMYMDTHKAADYCVALYLWVLTIKGLRFFWFLEAVASYPGLLCEAAHGSWSCCMTLSFLQVRRCPRGPRIFSGLRVSWDEGGFAGQENQKRWKTLYKKKIHLADKYLPTEAVQCSRTYDSPWLCYTTEGKKKIYFFF